MLSQVIAGGVSPNHLAIWAIHSLIADKTIYDTSLFLYGERALNVRLCGDFDGRLRR